MTLIAYIDPLSGSIILQAIAAVALGAAYHFGQFRKRLGSVLRSLVTRVRGR